MSSWLSPFIISAALAPLLSANRVSIFGVPDRAASVAILRELIPLLAFGQPQLLRFTLPLETKPELPSGNATGVGDLTIFD